MKKSKLLLISGILGSAYLIYIITYFLNGVGTAESDINMLAYIGATAVVTPHMVCVGLAVVFNWLGWILKARWAALVAGILYSVSIVLMFIYAIFVVLQAILCFVAFAKMNKNEQL
ncbi:hypothetical protein IMSAG049_01408 [Clostridiales bacterium]|nr:hypothetical protein IMSAG049_01408 [Clostridiales bacterium]